MSRYIYLIVSVTLVYLLLLLPIGEGEPAAETTHTFLIEGRTDISKGLPDDESFSSVDVFDSDGDGRDEIYLGAGSMHPPYTSGIWAYEYDPDIEEWISFGTGLPGADSDKSYGALALGDLDQDGDMDIVAPLLTYWFPGDVNGIEIYAGDGAGGFTLSHTIDCGRSSNEAIVADLDNDTYLDIAVSTTNSVKVWFGEGSLDSWSEINPPSAQNEMTGLDAGDLNNDGLLDIVACPYYGSHVIRLYVQTQSRTWKEIEFKEVKREGFGLRIEDIDLDGNQDVIYGTRNEGLRAWLGNGGGGLGGTDFKWTDASAGLHDSGGNWDQMELADITGDGKPELIAANNGGDDVYLYINDLPNGWTWVFRGDEDEEDAVLKESPLTIGGFPYGTNFGDWDGDGQLDCVACSWVTGVKAWLLTGQRSNVTGEITYPEGGETPPQLWGWDDYVFLTIFTALALIVVFLAEIVIWIGILARKVFKKKSKATNKDARGHFRLANIILSSGVPVMFIFQFLALLFSLNYESDGQILPSWEPPEMAGVVFLVFIGVAFVLLTSEFARRKTWKGLSTLTQLEDIKNEQPLKMAKRFLMVSYVLAYLGQVLLLISIFQFFLGEQPAPIFYFVATMLLPMAIFFNYISLNTAIEGTEERNFKTKAIIGIHSLFILLSSILFTVFMSTEASMIVLLLLLPFMYGVAIIISTGLNIRSLKKTNCAVIENDP